MIETRCAELEARDVAARYVAGTLATAEAEEFERHLIGCRDCQDAVRLGGVVRRELERPHAARPMLRARPTLLALALAAGIVAVAAIVETDRRQLRELGEVGTPPAYGGIAVRSAPSMAESVFADGMRHYGERRYADAESLLSAARARGADSTPSSFFLGVLSLMRGDGAAAVRDLGIVVARGNSPYTDEAHYYLAKAWLRRGEADSARAHLSRIGTGSPLSASALALADSVARATGAAR